MLVDLIAKAAGNLVDRPLDAEIRERLDLSAVAADEVVMMVPVRPRGFVAGDAVAGVYALHEA